jgi:hypothetical protein
MVNKTLTLAQEWADKSVEQNQIRKLNERVVFQIIEDRMKFSINDAEKNR